MLNRFARFSLAISEIDRCWHKLAAEEMTKYDLNSAHAFYLTTLIQYPEGVTAVKLSELCCKNKADVSRMISILEKKGLVRKECSGNSKYRGVFRLTPEGVSAAEHVRSRACLAVDLAGQDLTEEERQIFYCAMDSILQRLRVLSKDGLPEE